MQRDLALWENKMSEVEKATWYRQRFDACPHFMFFLGDAHISNIQHTKYPFGQRIAYAGFSKNRADWYHALGELEYTTWGILTKARSDALISKEMIVTFLPFEKAFYSACAHIDTRKLSELSDGELLALYQDLARVYTNKLNSSPLIDGFALSTDTLIAGQIKKFLEEEGLGDKFVEYFAVLTAPTFLSFLQQEEIALLEVAKAVAVDGTREEELLEKHQQNYFWIRNNYVKDHIESIEDFRTRLSTFKTIDVDARITELRALASTHAAEKQKLIREIDLPVDTRTLLTITDDFNAWQDERKKGTFFATHYFSLLLEEFARRTEYTPEQLKYAFPPEMESVLARKIDAKELDQRIEYCMLIWTLDHYDVTTDPSLIQKLERIGIGEAAPTHELKGFVASRGKVRGRAKVLESAEELSKVEDGDVLVAVMTRPDYLPAMQKAVAFVTDEGGITCHAAIVAREMKKPCIIGTKIATKTFKDGDEIEVDAEKGTVTLIEKS